MSLGDNAKSRTRKKTSVRRPEARREKSTNHLLRYLYIVGIQSVRILKRFFRRTGRFFQPMTNLFKRLQYALLGRPLEKIQEEVAHIQQGFNIAGVRMRAARRRGFFAPVTEFFKIICRSLVRHRRVLSTIFNTLTPTAAIMVLILTISYFGNQSYGLQVEWNGKDIAYVKSEEVYGSAAQMLDQRIVDDSVDSKDFSPKYTLAVLDNDAEINSADALCNKLIEESSQDYVQAYGLYVDNDLVGAVESAADMKFVLQSILDKGKGKDKKAKASFTSDVQLMDGLYSVDTLMETAEVEEKLTAKVQEEENTTVKKGQTGEEIAKRYGMTVRELQELNPDTDVDRLAEGEEIKVAKPRTFLTVKITKEEKRTEEIPYSTVTIKNNNQYTSYNVVTQKGSPGEVQITDSVTYVDGVEIARKTLEKVVLKEAVDQKVTVGTKKILSYGNSSGGRVANSTQNPTGSFIWPAPTVRVISSNYGYRWGRLHAGIDIANGRSHGQPVVASDAGTVSYVKHSRSGYGIHILINHGNGWTTMYAHLSAALVSGGQRVSKGQTIGRIGNTGRSTGNHLHFEIRKNGSPLNPRNYVRP